MHISNHETKPTVDLSSLSQADLEKISNHPGLPEDVRGDAHMLNWMREERGIEGEEIPEEWTVKINPATETKIRQILGKW